MDSDILLLVCVAFKSLCRAKSFKVGCIGSFNWFSATRDEKYQRYDTSMVYRGEDLKSEIKTIYNSLEQRLL